MANPIKLPINLTSYSKGSLFEEKIDLSCYPKKFILAEKSETIIYRGSFNSRMKDFHYTYSMISLITQSSYSNIEEIIRQVFRHRKTELSLSISFEEEELTHLQNFWNEYLKNLRQENLEKLPSLIGDVMTNINDWLRVNTSLI